MAIDSRLRWLLDERNSPQGLLHDAVELAAGARTAETAGAGGPAEIEVLVRATPDAERDPFANELRQAGFTIHSLGGVRGSFTATGSIPIGDLGALDSKPSVARVEAPRDLQPELLVSIDDCRASDAHALVPPATGGRALVGVIDGGIDCAHPVFRRPGGATRIQALWDQTGPPVAGGSVPYGRVYTAAQIDAALGGAGSLPRDGRGHGTHVACIAAGSVPRNGVAHEADLLIVRLGGDGQTLGRSKNAIDAFEWIVDQARRQDKPVAINMSQGMNGGSHAGTSILEVAMDAHCREPGVAVVKSAGNEQDWMTHASGVVPLGGILTFEVVCHPPGKRSPGHLELWFDARDELEVSVVPPAGTPTGWVDVVNVPRTFNTGGNSIRIDAELDPEDTADHLVNVFFAAGGSAIGIVPGTWRVLVRARHLGAAGLVHAWLERTGRDPASEQLRFSLASNDPTCTISIPGTARRILTVGSYVTSPMPPGSSLVGALSGFSSRGPTRYGAQKPDLIAPGEFIEAARSSHVAGPGGPWVRMQGTSMAAPHVAGAAALLLAEDPRLTGEQVRQILTRSARATGASPDSTVGAGCLDVAAAVNLLRSGTVGFPSVTRAQLVGSNFEIDTRDDSTASLLYGTNPGRVMAGHRTGSLPSLTLRRTHVFDLSGIGSGTWHFEVHLFASGWRTIADDDGAPWSITLP